MKLPLGALTALAGVTLLAGPNPITSNPAPYPKEAKSSVERVDPALNALIAADA